MMGLSNETDFFTKGFKCLKHCDHAILSQSYEVNSRKPLFLKIFHPQSFESSKNQILNRNISRTKKDFGMRFFSVDLYCSPLHSDQELAKSLE